MPAPVYRPAQTITQEDANVGNATNFGIPGVNQITPTTPQQPMQEPEQPKQVATTIVWEDGGQTQVEPGAGRIPGPIAPTSDQAGPTQGAPQGQGQTPVGPADSLYTTPEDEEIADLKPEETHNAVINSGGDQKLATDAAEWAGNSNGIVSSITQLDKLIQKQEGRRDSMRMMMFGLALLSGEGMSNAVSIANKVGTFNKDRLDALYDSRKELQTAITKQAIEAQYGPTGDDAFSSQKLFEKPYVFYDNENNRKVGYKLKEGAGYADESGNPVDTAVWNLAGELETDENIRQAQEEVLVKSDENFATSLSNSSSLIADANRNISLIEQNIDRLGTPLDRTKLGQALSRNFGISLTGSETDIELIELLRTQLESQQTKIVAAMRAQGVTFGAMTEGEWRKIQAQVGDLEGTLGGISLAQNSIKVRAIAAKAEAEAYDRWRTDKNNRGKSLLNFKTWYENSDQKKQTHEYIQEVWDAGLEKAKDINAKSSGGSDATYESEDIDSILDKY